MAGPTPHISFEGPALSFDFPAVKIGVAEYEEGPTGTTVLYFPKSVLAAIDVRGGAPGTFNSDVLHHVHDEAFLSAIVLSGGSAYGLSAAAGVANALKETTPDPGNWRNVAVVSGAIIFDLGDRRYNAVTPDELLGRAALRTARSGWFPLGARGAGSFAMQGAYLGDRQHSGQGAALRQIGETKVLVVTVVNALGSITDRSGRLLRCSSPANGQCELTAAKLAEHLHGAGEKLSDLTVPTDGPTANTTITVVVTNQALPFSALQRLAIQVHNSMARAIQPFGTFADGDTLFAVTTGEVKNTALNALDLNTLASETAWDAILATAPAMPTMSARSAAAPSHAMLQAYIGRYTLAPEVTADVHWQGGELAITVAGRDSLYLPADRSIALEPWASEEFALATARGDHLRFDRDARGRISGFTVNPGPWPIRAQRLPNPPDAANPVIAFAHKSHLTFVSIAACGPLNARFGESSDSRVSLFSPDWLRCLTSSNGRRRDLWGRAVHKITTSNSKWYSVMGLFINQRRAKFLAASSLSIMAGLIAMGFKTEAGVPPSAAPAAQAADQSASSENTASHSAKPAMDRSGRARFGKASFYANRFGGRKMADGRRMDLQADNAASRTPPLGTTAKVTNLETGQSSVVVIQDRGPYVDGRIVDLSPATAEKIGLTRKQGVVKVAVSPIVVPMPDGRVKLGAAANDPEVALNLPERDNRSGGGGGL